MIYTVTFNPSLDYAVGVDDLKLGEVNRMSFEQILPGGKGINVTVVLKNLGFESTALGFIAGFTGSEIRRLLDENQCKSDFIVLPEGSSRINVKLKSSEETDINGQGPDIDRDAIDALFQQLDAIADGDTLIISGSIPDSLPDNMYEMILERLQNKNIRIVVDATKDLLTNVLAYGPFLIKPNNHELGEIFGVKLSTREEVVPYAKIMQERGARNVLVSMAGAGAVLVAENGTVYQCDAPKGKVINSVGAGDSMVAGFVAGYLESGGNYADAFRQGVATGSASAFSANLATKEEVQRLMGTFEVTSI